MFTKAIAELLQSTFFDHGLEVILIGGGARAILNNRELPRDLDFEIRAPKLNLGAEEWKKFLYHHLKDFEVLKYGVFRKRLGGYSMEFASPRAETHIDQCLDHCNFTAELSCDLDDCVAFSRRDLTINAFGYLFSGLNDYCLIDPFHGVDDYSDKILRNVSKTFHFDPVRVLRALRFSLELGFSFSNELMEEMKLADLSRVSMHYIVREGSKVNFGEFIKLLLTFDTLPESYRQLSILQDFDTLSDGLKAIGRNKMIPLNEYVDLLRLLEVGIKKYKVYYGNSEKF